MAHYAITVDTTTDGPSMARMVDAVAYELERYGLNESQYYVKVEGPPELTIGVRHRDIHGEY